MVLFGNPAVGKTSLIQRYINDKFQSEYISTLGYDVFEKAIDLDGILVTFLIFDIGGQEQFVNLRKKYAEGAKAALLVYDITNRDSFNNIKNWYNDLMEFTNNAHFVLIGNKIDLEDERQILTEEGVNLAQELGADGFFETSAKENIGIDETFLNFAKALTKK